MISQWEMFGSIIGGSQSNSTTRDTKDCTLPHFPELRTLLCSVSHQYREILYLHTIGFLKLILQLHVIFNVLVSHRNIIMYILQIYALRTSSPRIVLIYALHTSSPRIARPVHGLYHKPWIQGCANPSLRVIYVGK